MKIEIRDMRVMQDHKTIMAFFKLGIFQNEKSGMPFAVVPECRLMYGNKSDEPWIAYPAKQDNRGKWENMYQCFDDKVSAQILEAANMEYGKQMNEKPKQERLPTTRNESFDNQHSTLMDDDEDLPF
jgi:DNA-binding cell septation regulator SpoVG